MSRDEAEGYFREILGIPPRTREEALRLLEDVREPITSLEVDEQETATIVTWATHEEQSRERVRAALQCDNKRRRR